jgi:hypothetical protein
MNGVISDSDIYSINALACGDRPAIVTLDFSLFSSGPTVGSLLAGANCDHRVLGVNAVSDMASSLEYFPLAALASGYSGALGALGTTVGLIVGRCSGAALATRLAAAMAADGDRAPAVALISPIWPTLSDVIKEFAEIRRSLQLPGVLPGHPEHSLPSAQDPRSLLSQFDLALRADLAAMCDSEELNEEERTIFLSELADMYRAWLGFLLATADAGPVRPAGSLHIIAGSTGGNGSRALPPVLSADQIITLPVADADLLGFADLPAQIYALLKE